MQTNHDIMKKDLRKIQNIFGKESDFSESAELRVAP